MPVRICFVDGPIFYLHFGSFYLSVFSYFLSIFFVFPMFKTVFLNIGFENHGHGEDTQCLDI